MATKTDSGTYTLSGAGWAINYYWSYTTTATRNSNGTVTINMALTFGTPAGNGDTSDWVMNTNVIDTSHTQSQTDYGPHYVTSTTGYETTKNYTWTVSENGYAGNITFAWSVAIGSYGGPGQNGLQVGYDELSYTVSYNKNGGTSTPASQKKYYGVALTLASAISHNNATASITTTFNGNGGSTPSAITSTKTTVYSFSYWSSSQGNYSAGGSYTTNAAATMTAQWGAILEYSSITLPTPTRTGYAFLGWYTASSGGTRIGGGGFTYTPYASSTVYAQWKAQTSVISAHSGTIGSSFSISWTRYESTFTHTLTYAFGSESGTIGTGLGVSTTWTPSMNLCNQLPNSVSGTGTLTLSTYSGSTLIGSSQATVTLGVPSSVVPSFTYTLSEGTASGFSRYATNLSTLRSVLSTTGSYGSTVKTAVLTFDGKSYSGNVSNNSVTLTTDTLTITGSRSVSMTITDSRGRTATNTSSITVYEWFAPRITDIEVSVSGTTVIVKVTGEIASVDSQNTKWLTIKKTRTSDQTETVVYSRTSQSSYSVSVTVSQTVSDIGTETYLYKAYLEDAKQTSTSEKLTGIICISRYAGGKGVAFFGEADQDGFTIWDGGTKVDMSINSSDWSTLSTWYSNN